VTLSVGRLSAVACIGVWLAALSPGVLGHEAGTTRVDAAFAPSGTYLVTLTTDAEALLARLEAARKQRGAPVASLAELQQRFDLVCPEVANHARLAFDGAPADLRPICRVDPEPTGPEQTLDTLGVTVQLTGEMPARHTIFTWRFDLTFTKYALAATTVGGGQPSTIWLEGGQESPALPVIPTPADASSGTRSGWEALSQGVVRVLPKGPDHVLFVFSLLLLTGGLLPTLRAIGCFALGLLLGLCLFEAGVSAPPEAFGRTAMTWGAVWMAARTVLTSPPSPLGPYGLAAIGLVDGLGSAAWRGPSPEGDVAWFWTSLALTAGVGLGQLATAAAGALILGARHKREPQLVAVPASWLIATIGLLLGLRRLAG